MKSFFRFVLRALVLLVVALVSALTAMRYAIHGAEVAVPNFAGKTPVEARKIAEDNGLQFLSERQYYSDSVPEGRILSQLPSAGAKVRRGWQVRVAESLGKQRVEIPNVLGESQRTAELNIERRGLDVASVAKISQPGVAPDEVISQSPLPEANGISSPDINLLVAHAPEPQAWVMPAFIGQSLNSATSALLTGGWRPENISATMTGPVPVPGGPALPADQHALPTSVIVTQTPPYGVKVVAGTAITFTVR